MLHDVAVDQHGRVGDAVADHLVDGGAQRLRKALVAQGGRVRAVVEQELVADPVELVGRDTRHDVASDLGQRLRGDAPATRIRSIVSASFTSGPVVRRPGAGRSTYSGRAMDAGTGRRGLMMPGVSVPTGAVAAGAPCRAGCRCCVLDAMERV